MSFFCSVCKVDRFVTPYVSDGKGGYMCARHLEPTGEPDMVNHPPHYESHPSGVECIEITRHMNFNCGNAFKYIWRNGEKGDPIIDLRKAAWYINDEIKRLERLATDGTEK